MAVAARSHEQILPLPRAYTLDFASRITGLTRRQLEYWDSSDVIKPSVAPYGGRGSARLYSFQDLIRLKVGAGLRQRGWRPSEIRRAVAALELRGWRDPLVTATLVAAKDGGHEVMLVDPSLGRPVSARHPDQVAEPMDIPLEEIRTGLETTIADHLRRDPGKTERVRDLQGSAPVIAGTRVPVARIRELHRRGWDVPRILAAHPHLMPQDITVALGQRTSRNGRLA